jgi:hypothetical protein
MQCGGDIQKKIQRGIVRTALQSGDVGTLSPNHFRKLRLRQPLACPCLACMIRSIRLCRRCFVISS